MTEPKVTQTRGAFSMTCGLKLNIRAAPEVIWSLLTDARGSMPDLGPVFATFANDLKREAERAAPGRL